LSVSSAIFYPSGGQSIVYYIMNRKLASLNQRNFDWSCQDL